MVELLGASGATGAFSMITLFTRTNFFRLENGASATRTIFLFILIFDHAGINKLMVNVRGSRLRAILLVVALFAVESTVHAVIGL